MRPPSLRAPRLARPLTVLAGWFLLLSSCVGFYRVKRWEASIRAASLLEEPMTPEQRARDEQVRRNIELAFGFGVAGDEDEDEEDGEHMAAAQDENAQRRTSSELRLARTLQAAGLM